ncbi:MAG: DUF362 domain-containing protein [Chthoniobacterales bacterium]|nr:DUF362 domain-containing protein [Chthoniobacterales bacterium]
MNCAVAHKLAFHRVILLLFRIVFVLCLLLSSARAQTAPPASTPSTVYIAHDAAAIQHYRTDDAVVRKMVDRLLLAVTGQSEVARAWRALVSPTDKVGIKISASGGELFSTHRAVVEAIADGLASAGVSRHSIIVWDRNTNGARAAGYRGGDRYQLLSVAPRDGYDAKAIFSAPIMGKLVWGDLDYRNDRGRTPLLSDKENTSSESHFCRILSSQVTKVINVPVMGDNPRTGIAGCVYNMTVPNLDNWRRFTAGASGGSALSLVEMYADPIIEKKVVLNLMDGLVAQYAGGVEAAPNFALHYATILASKDPVAIDAIALRQIERWRSNAHLPAIGDLAAHVEIAGQAGLGNADPARIALRNVKP